MNFRLFICLGLIVLSCQRKEIKINQSPQKKYFPRSKSSNFNTSFSTDLFCPHAIIIKHPNDSTFSETIKYLIKSHFLDLETPIKYIRLENMLFHKKPMRVKMFKNEHGLRVSYDTLFENSDVIFITVEGFPNFFESAKYLNLINYKLKNYSLPISRENFYKFNFTHGAYKRFYTGEILPKARNYYRYKEIE